MRACQVGSVMSDSLWPMDCSPQAPLSMGFSRQGYQSGFLCPPPGERPHPGIKPGCVISAHIGRQVLYHWHHLGSPILCIKIHLIFTSSSPVTIIPIYGWGYQGKEWLNNLCKVDASSKWNEAAEILTLDSLSWNCVNSLVLQETSVLFCVKIICSCCLILIQYIKVWLCESRKKSRELEVENISIAISLSLLFYFFPLQKVGQPRS